MKYQFINYGTAALVAGVLMLPTTVSAQHSRGGGTATGTAVGRTPGPASTPAPAPAPRPAPASAPASGGSSEGSGSSGGGQTRQRSGGESRGGARARSGSGEERSGGGQAGGGQDGAATASNPRPRGDREAIGHSVRRRPGSGGTTVVVPGGYYPWAWGGLGFGGFYGAYYDPWGYGGYDGYGYGGYQGGGYSSGYGDEGKLRLKVKPRDASVFIDGYFAGVVDEFDGVFQRLNIGSGPHRVEIRADGYETLTFEVQIQPGRTVTYTQDLKKLP